MKGRHSAFLIFICIFKSVYQLSMNPWFYATLHWKRVPSIEVTSEVNMSQCNEDNIIISPAVELL